MRFVRIFFEAIGPFTNVNLELPRGKTDLHIIYGPNEAGKTSAVRAIQQLLFGFHRNTQDDFLHPKGKLSVGAEIEDPSGNLVRMFRYGARGNVLIDPETSRPIDQDWFSQLMAGLSAETFFTIFGVTHEQLVEGGRQFVCGEGEIGQLLFSAASGIARLQSIADELRQQADELFRPRGKKQKLNEALARLRSLRRNLRESKLPVSRWQKLQDQLGKTDGEIKQLRDKLHELREKRSRIEKMVQAVPKAREYHNIQRQLDQLAKLPILPEDFGGKLSELEAEYNRLDATCEEKRKTLEQKRNTYKQLKVPQQFLTYRTKIEGLYKRWVAQQKAEADSENLKRQVRTVEQELESLRQRLGAASRVENILGLAESGTLRELGQILRRISNLRQDSEAKCREHERLQQELDRVKAEIKSLSNIPDPAIINAGLQQVERWQQEGDLEAELRRRQLDFERRKELLEAEVLRTGIWKGDLREFSRMPLPNDADIDIFLKQDQQLEAKRQKLHDRLRELQDKKEATEQQLAQLRVSFGQVSRDDLEYARRLRDYGWQCVLAEWRGLRVSDEVRKEFFSKFGNYEDLALAYAESVANVDKVTDSLLEKAELLGKIDQLTQQVNELNSEIARVEGEIGRLNEQRQQFEHRWEQFCQTRGFITQAPTQFGEKLRILHRLQKEALDLLDEQLGQIRTLENKLQEGKEKLADLLKRTGTSLSDTDLPWTEIVTFVLEHFRSLRDKNVRLADLRSKAERLESELNRLATELRDIDDRLQDEQHRWENLLNRRAVAANVSPAEFEEVYGELNEIVGKRVQLEELRKRIREIEEDGQDLAHSARNLAEQVWHGGQSISLKETDTIVDELHNGLQNALKIEQRKRELEEEIQTIERQLQSCEEELGTVVRQLERMCAKAGCQSAKEAYEVWQQVQERRRLQEKALEIESELQRLASGQPLDGFIDEALSADETALYEELERIGQEWEEKQSELEQANQRRGELAKEKDTLEQSDGAAVTAEQLEATRAEAEQYALHYARLTLARAMLQEGIEYFRERHQGKLVERASEIFRRITCGAFSRLEVRYDSGKPQLVAIRSSNGEEVRHTVMSDGTADQLYLAVRLAALEQLIASKRPLPLILDDILVGFDDERAQATFGVLAEIAARMQILFFTHHEHLLRLAEAGLGKDGFNVQRLPRYRPGR